ncbi:MAG: ABC transporter permease [Bacteroidales bacterium]|nr:ABC transporter permease [Bacteroidales bacterium]
MLKYVLKRLFYGFWVLLGVITLVFFLFNVLPGDPTKMLLGQRSDIASVEAIRKDLGLDKPLYTQYFSYLNDLSPISIHSTSEDSYWHFSREKYTSSKPIFTTGNKIVILKKPYLRRSYQSQRNVTSILAEAFPQTAILAIVAILFSIFVGITIGVLCAIYKDTWFDKISLIVSVFGMALPSFFAAIVMGWIFAFLLHDVTGLNMIGSMYTVDNFGEGEYLDLKNLILPAITLGIRPLAVVVELTRSSVLEVLSQDYVRTARAKGLPRFKVIFSHVLKNSMNPVVTAISGWFASLMAGAVFVEYIFDWKGVGIVIVNALEKYDFPVLMGALLFISVILVFINIFVDIIYGWLDPKIRLS